MLGKWNLESDVGRKSEKPVLKFTLTVLAVAGCWQPTSWTSPFRHIIYNAYTVSVILILFTFAMTQIMDLILNAHEVNADVFGDALFNALISLLACYKTIVMKKSHEIITTLINNLGEMPFKPLDLNENMIREKFDKRITNNTLYYLVLVLISGSYMILLSLFTDFKNGMLMCRAWIPFDYSMSALYYPVYAHQIICIVFIGLVHPTCDNLICGLLLHICCQFEILEYRLSNITDDQENLHDCVRHHIRIFEYAYILNDKFGKIVPGEFAMITVVICYNLVHMATTSSSTSYIQNIMSVACTLAPIFYYCWFGNEIKLKSLQLPDNIYNMEWTIFSNNMKKSLLMIMNRATIPIEFTSANFMPMNLDSFVTVLKTSYSFFNVLKQSQ